ncbi:MAG: hypothetical protein FJ303_18170 [Planctomycetes bacterium]|nr:hypothetical protein [Planctomycetota bacterium]
MLRSIPWLLVLLVAGLPGAANAQKKQRDAIVIYKDGFYIKGKIEERVGTVIYDRESGRAFPLASGEFTIDDHVRKIMFTPTHVQKVIQLKEGEVKEPMKITRIKSIFQPREIHATWEFSNFGKWSDSCERTVTMRTQPSMKFPAGGTITIEQKIGLLTPQYLFAVSDTYKWDLSYATREFEPEMIRGMLLRAFKELKQFKGLKEGDRYLQVAAFLHEAGWYEEAETDLDNLVKNYPDQKKIAEELLAKVRKQRADVLIESAEQAKKVGQHNIAIARLEQYQRQEFDKIVSPRYRDLATDLKADYDRDKTRIELARKFLKDLPPLTKKKEALWTKATESILDELNYDTVDRLTEFLSSAAQHERQRKEGLALTQSTEQVLALAVTGWLQGKQAFDTDPKVALQLYSAREFLRGFLTCDDIVKRTSMLSNFRKDNMPPDVLTRLIRMTPPAEAHSQIDTKIQTMKLPGGGTYLVQLPPDYHHQRAYPVLFALHSGRESSEETLKRLSEEAAKYGFILVAPNWAGNKFLRARYQYSEREHDVLLEALKDARRKFQVDSDRVFLFGWEDGANMAFDVALEHPDLFAGVVPMNGTLTPFARRFFWTNAQYLPFYVIEGERNTSHTKVMHSLFKDNWTREPFVSMYVEYRGRMSEWFSAEIPNVFNWMSRKKRYTPVRQMGVPGTSGGLGVEFRTSRNNDNRFYWLTYGAIADRHRFDCSEKKWHMNYQPATFQAELSVGNQFDKSSSKERIWNRVTVRVSGGKGLSFWIMQDMMDLSKKVEVFLNGSVLGGMRDISPSVETLLDALQQTGDRQRLFVAKIEMR